MKATILVITLFLTTFTSAFAGHGDNSLDRIIHRKISYPESLREKGVEASVYVKVRILAENKLEILQIASDSEEMKAIIEKQVQQIKIKVPQSLVGNTFNYTFKFQVQK
ncbi:hypothetical protein [Fluviicola taffensis]|uniref:TonB family protein n=1 Tax=Fluviicola taffensis (strain DSM 16823 / NCIMB 13979 / RW262) TaxID=755732 RepID=F2ICI0_FLUTR|nr:hypothetical protein [Fluviicola taffensis]AEA45450.1 hypothetical protein Fluta_3479 [Fluviicola taffensis DSM 16823]